MMIIDFIKLRLRETTRSAAWNKNLAINILFGFFMLYMTVNFLLLGFLLDRILLQAFPDDDPVALVNGMLFYYLGVELLVRFLMQQTPAMSITPFLHLPVRRSRLMHLLLARSTVSPLNYISFLIFIPFAIRAVSLYSGMAACLWLLMLFLLVVFVIYINVYVKRQMVVKPLVSLSCGLAFIALIVADIFGLLPISDFSAAVFGAILAQPLWILAPVALVAGVYLLNYRFLKACSYPEEIDRTVRKGKVAVRNLGFMSRFGLIGELLGLELKLILRHKRTKSVLFVTPIFLLYGFMFYTLPVYSNSMGWLVFTGIIVTGMTMLSYGNYIVSWESKFFDGILTREGSILDYFRSKYYFLVLLSLVSYVLTSPYAFLGMKFLGIQTACFLFNIGVNTLLMLWFAQYSRKRVELSQGSAFNWQGTGASNFIVLLPAMLLPVIIVSLFSWVDRVNWGLSILALLGVTGLLCHKWILQLVCRNFAHTKYAQAEGFRER